MSNEPVTKVRPMRADASGTAREKAYIIDDDPLMAELLERRLERRGYEPVRFDDPGRLLDEITSDSPAVLFTDLEMPRMGGADLAAKARERGYRGTIVVATASRERDDLVAAIKNGADEIIAKPVKDDDLDLLIAKAKARALRSLTGIESLRSVLEPVGQGVVLLDEECVAFYANRRAREILDAAGVREVQEVLDRGKLAAQVMKEQGGYGGVVFVDVSKPDGGGSRHLVGFETHEI
ncbi:MAG: response regulator, partial [Candidatus Krumholzibacteriaceae bacterium]